MGTTECSQPASKSSWDSQDFGGISMVLKMTNFRKSTGPRWVNTQTTSLTDRPECDKEPLQYNTNSGAPWITSSGPGEKSYLVHKQPRLYGLTLPRHSP